MSIKPLKAMLTVVLTTTASIMIAPAASAGSCGDGTSGFYAESAQCAFDCLSGDYVSIMVSVDDTGNVQGSGSCGGAGASCFRSDGFCSASSAPLAAASQNIGSCQGTGNGGFWTHVEVYCWTDGGDDQGGASLSELRRKLKINYNIPIKDVEYPSDPDVRSLTVMVMDRVDEAVAKVTAVTCKSDGDECETHVPVSSYITINPEISEWFMAL